MAIHLDEITNVSKIDNVSAYQKQRHAIHLEI
jgi:hypothetical protein